ncbi:MULTISPECIES: dethiobiotin synthase [unclassified Prochlorococcus]|uniref:dethiobiotin synthase n=1 Tax=unclassified Prochlorococcus TaxID=2627481 RepID=UPI000533B573|nr:MULTISPECIES: dethiobiotin synthase [unclassified Prochlorococcus]KGG14767.1 Dethiobiotin synthetase [Prochlorococcus sp. MIT 0602]KGG15801.1 Dethiobiotin synthetase [Prochlorococcus sp. MIT 0603]
MNLQTLRVIVCGTDTDVGKTIVSSLLVQGLNAIYWKPIQSGLEDGSDTNTVCDLLSLPKGRYLPELYKFKAPVSPHWAAEQENTMIKSHTLKLPIRKHPLVIETAGGVMVPLNRQYLQIDLLEEWMLPIILVARSGLGTLNHTLLTIEALKKRKIPILGIILNGAFHKDNPKTLQEFGGIPILAQLPILSKISTESLSEQWTKQKLAHQIEIALRLTN